MKVREFLEHHSIRENPFGQEDAQDDHVFRQYCLQATHHPAWDKIYGNPQNPSTAVVFGEKGSGKTALSLQVVAELEKYNRSHPEQRVYIIRYNDFNAFLDSFRERLRGRRRRPDRALTHWRLWDHMDAILTIGVTQLVDAITEPKTADGESDNRRGAPGVSREQLRRLAATQKRDLLVLAAFYDHSLDEPRLKRWRTLRRRMHYHSWTSAWDLAAGVAVTLVTIGLRWYLADFQSLFVWWIAAIIVVGWLPWLLRQARLMWSAWRVSRQVRIFDHQPNTLRSILSRFERQQLSGQPMPTKDRSDDRYELLLKFQNVLKTLGFRNIVVLVDRVDEPHLVNGSPERIRDLLWPMFDNKFLKHPDIGFKLLLPSEVTYYLDRQEKHFYERSRLDKQNLIRSLEWTGESLYDIANERIRACAEASEQAPGLSDLFQDDVGREELVTVFARLRVPRHLFKFLHRLLVEHCNRYTSEQPQWKIGRETMQTTLALYTRDMEAFDRGAGTG